MDKKEYELVIRLTENSLDANDLFYRISAYLATSKIDEALNVVTTKREILKKHLSSLIRVHIELLCLSNKFDEARKELEYYANLPYESQVVEETLRSMPELINNEEKKLNTYHALNDDELIKRLTSSEDSDVLMALDMVRVRDCFTFLPYIARILSSYPKQSIRSFALLLLVQKEIDRELKYLSSKGLITVNPKKLTPPFVGDKFNNLVKLMHNEYKDPSLAENAIQILSSYLLYIYPETYTCDDSLLIGALYFIALKYLNRENEVDLNDYAFDHELNIEELKSLIDNINTSLDNF